MENLPYQILRAIFTYASEIKEEGEEKSRGGKLITWDSNESLNSMSLVCRGWQDAAQSILYQSVAICSAVQATKFLNTLKTRKDLKERVKALVIGLGEVKESCQIDLGQKEDSKVLVQVIESCPSLLHLQVRPLPEVVRESLLSAITSKPLLSLVCAPRLVRPNVGWTHSLFYSIDTIQLALPSLIRLELDFWSESVSFTSPFVPPLRLVELRLHCDLPHELLYLLLKAAGSTLEVLDLYFERILSPDEMTLALSYSVKTLKRFRYITNPTLEELNHFDSTATPIFDRILPHYQQLTKLSVSATEVSTNLFRLLPPCLKELEIQSFNHHGTFGYSNLLIAALKDENIDFKLESLTIYDAAEVWEDNVETLRKACRDRNIEFFFLPDGEDGGSDG